MDEFRESLDECISAFSPENLAYKSTCSYLKNLHETVPRLKSEKKIFETQIERITVAEL